MLARLVPKQRSRAHPLGEKGAGSFVPGTVQGSWGGRKQGGGPCSGR